jgi:hypothetical protein
VIGQLPPYALSRSTFPFPGLAAQVGRAGLGGSREAILATLVVARLCAALLRPYDLSHDQSAVRSAQARTWLSSLTLGAGIKTLLAAIMDAAGRIDRKAVAEGLEKLAANATAGFDAVSREEIGLLVARMRADGGDYT